MILVMRGSEETANISIEDEFPDADVYEKDRGGILFAHVITDVGDVRLVLARGKKGYVALAKQLLKIAKQRRPKKRRSSTTT